jgi:hypothetical protein
MECGCGGFAAPVTFRARLTKPLGFRGQNRRADLLQTVRKVAGLGRKVARGVGLEGNLGRLGLIGGLSDLRGFQATVIRSNRAA